MLKIGCSIDMLLGPPLALTKLAPLLDVVLTRLNCDASRGDAPLRPKRAYRNVYSNDSARLTHSHVCLTWRVIERASDTT